MHWASKADRLVLLGWLGPTALWIHSSFLLLVDRPNILQASYVVTLVIVLVAKRESDEVKGKGKEV